MKVISTIISASLLIGSVASIFGGEPVSPESASKYRRLQQKSYTTGIRKDNETYSEDNFSFCGGVLISRSHVLTTMTCTIEGNANFVSVGAIYINGGEDGDEIKVVNVTKHPGFNKKTLSNNFAVLKLAKNVRATIRPVKLPTSGIELPAGKVATAMGWGVTSTVGMASEVLLKLDQQLITNEQCRKALHSTTIDMTHVCAGGEEGKSPCAGDTGGPLIYENNEGDGDDVLVGLISGGINLGCSIKGSPAIYSRVSSALDWIATAMKA